MNRRTRTNGQINLQGIVLLPLTEISYLPFSGQNFAAPEDSCWFIMTQDVILSYVTVINCNSLDFLYFILYIIVSLCIIVYYIHVYCTYVYVQQVHV